MKVKEIITVVVLFLLDIGSKYFMESILMIGTPIKIIENFFYLNLVYNDGAAWGMLSGEMEIFFVITILVLGVMWYLLIKSDKSKIFFRISILLIIAGTLGNCYDRVLFSSVRDFLDFYIFGYDYPVFNFADMYICIGYAIMAIYLLRHPGELD